MDKQITFSIIIPVYNAENYISECLNSILRQTYKYFEIVCINDGSTDNSLKILQDYSKKNKCIRLFSIENSGPSIARNMGLKYATGDYVLFLDSDDYLSKNSLRILSSKIDNKNAPDVMIFGAKIISKDTIPNWVIESTTSKDESFNGDAYKLLPSQKNLVPFIWNKAYKRDFLFDNNIVFKSEIKLGEDKLFLYDVFIKATKLLFLSNKLYNYRWQRQDSIMTTFKENKLKTTENHLKMILEVLRSLKSNNILEYRVDDTLQWMVALLYNSYFKDLPECDQKPFANEFFEYYKNNNIESILYLDNWDKINIFALNSILCKADCSATSTLSVIMHENSAIDYGQIINSFLKQRDIDIEIIIVCFSTRFYNYINNRYGDKCRVFLFPDESFSFAKNLGIRISKGEYVLFPSYKESLSSNDCIVKAVGILKNNLDCIACVCDAKHQFGFERYPQIMQNADFKILSQIIDGLSNIIFRNNTLKSRGLRFNQAGGYENNAFIINTLLNKKIVFSDIELQTPFYFYDTSLEDIFSCNKIYIRDYLLFVKAISKAIIINNDLELAKHIISSFDKNHSNLFDNQTAINLDDKEIYSDLIMLYPLASILQDEADFQHVYERLKNIIVALEEYDANLRHQIVEREKVKNKILSPNAIKNMQRIRNSFAAKLYRRIKKK